MTPLLKGENKKALDLRLFFQIFLFIFLLNAASEIPAYLASSFFLIFNFNRFPASQILKQVLIIK